jgi:hypothetical protein
MGVATASSLLPGLTAGAAWVALFGFLGLAVRIWLTQRPAMKRLTMDENAVLRDDYTKQIAALREERQADRGEIKVLGSRLGVVENESRRRADKINNLTFIVQLVMNELQRIDPNSIILKQAARLMIQLSQPLDANPAETLRDLARIDEAVVKQMSQSATLNAAEDTALSAEQTHQAADDAVAQVKFDEEKNRGGGK